MSFAVRNLQRSVPLNVKRFQNHVSILMNVFGIENYSIGVIFVSKLRMSNINKVYRKFEGPTDVLSFPNYQGLFPGQLPELDLNSPTIDNNLGDIFLCASVIREQSMQETTADFHNSLPVYVTHGICHLLGYTHSTEDDWKLMFCKEKEILSVFEKKTGLKCAPLTLHAH